MKPGFEMEKSLREIRMDGSYAAQPFMRKGDYGRSIENLNALQSEMYIKQKQNELQSAEFFNEMMNHSRLMITAIKNQ